MIKKYIAIAFLFELKNGGLRPVKYYIVNKDKYLQSFEKFITSQNGYYINYYNKDTGQFVFRKYLYTKEQAKKIFKEKNIGKNL